MKILLVGNEYYQQFPLNGYGGIETCVENLADGLYKNNIDFEVIVPKINKNKKKYPFTIHEIDKVCAQESGMSVLDFIKSVKMYIKNNNLNPDIIWTQSNWSADGLHDLNKPIICTIHDSNIDMVRNKEIKYYKNVFYRYVSKFLLESNFKNIINNNLLNNSFYCHTGIVDNEFFLDKNKENYALWVAGFNWGWTNKGLDIFIKLSQDFPSKEFICYGSGNKEIENKLSSLKFSNFHYMGSLNRGEQHRKIFSKADKFLMLSRLPEAFGRTTVEALTKGTAVIATDTGANKELILDNGIVTNKYNELLNFLDAKYDSEKIFNYSKKFNINNEINYLLNKSKELL